MWRTNVPVCASVCALRSFPNVKYLMKWLSLHLSFRNFLFSAKSTISLSLCYSRTHCSWAATAKTLRKKSINMEDITRSFFLHESRPRIRMNDEKSESFIRRKAPASMFIFQVRISLIILHNSYHLSTRIPPDITFVQRIRLFEWNCVDNRAGGRWHYQKWKIWCSASFTCKSLELTWILKPLQVAPSTSVTPPLNKTLQWVPQKRRYEKCFFHLMYLLL